MIQTGFASVRNLQGERPGTGQNSRSGRSRCCCGLYMTKTPDSPEHVLRRKSEGNQGRSHQTPNALATLEMTKSRSAPYATTIATVKDCGRVARVPGAAEAG